MTTPCSSSVFMDCADNCAFNQTLNDSAFNECLQVCAKGPYGFYWDFGPMCFSVFGIMFFLIVLVGLWFSYKACKEEKK